MTEQPNEQPNEPDERAGGTVVPFPDRQGRDDAPAATAAPGGPDDPTGSGAVVPTPRAPLVAPAAPSSTVPGLVVAPVWEQPIERRPVLPAWVTDAQTRAAARGWAAGYVWHTVRFHGVRVPVYCGRLVAASPRGLGRAVAATARWAVDADTAGLRRESQWRTEPRELVALMRARREVVQTRLGVLGIAAVALAVVALAVVTGPGWVHAAAVAVTVGVLGALGRRQDRPLVEAAIIAPGGPRRLTDRIVLRALSVVGLGGKAARPTGKGATRAGLAPSGDGTEDDEYGAGPARLVQPIARDGAGWRALLDLPYGRTAAHAVAKHEELASALDVDAVQLFIEPVRGSQRRISLWVADSDPYAGKPNPSPLAACPRVSVWSPQRLGVDVRGQEVRVPLVFNGFVVGSVPRQGKTFTVRNLVAPAILDPYCDVSILGAKSSDWEDGELVAVNYCAGEGDDATVAYVVAALRKLLAECQAVYDAIRALPRDQRPEGKITPELQAKGFRPHLIVLEEAQNVLVHRDARTGKKSKLAAEAIHLLTTIAKVGPAAGFTLVFATQRPSTDVIPADLRDVLSVRIALKVNDRTSSDTILGDYRSARGIESASLINGVHAGVATLVGIDNGRGGDSARLRTDLLTAEQFGRVCQVGRQRRLDAGTLRGHAAGQIDDVAVAVSLLADVLAVWPGNEPKVWAETLCERLAELRPALYRGLEPAGLTSSLSGHGIRRVQVNRAGVNKGGYALTDLQNAADTTT